MGNFVNGRDCDNPNRGREAYVTGSKPCEYVKPKGAINNTTIPDTPDPDVDPPDNSQCLIVDGDRYEYDNNLERYQSSANKYITYNSIQGWVLSINGINYLPATVSTNPTNVYCLENEAFAAIPCDKVASKPLPSCIELKLAGEGITLGQFMQQNPQAFSPSSAGVGGVLTYTTSNWEYMIGQDVYVGSPDINDPTGLYRTSDGKCVVFEDCA